MLLLDKNNCVNIRENFGINKFQEIKELKIKNKKLTINSILNSTQQRLGNKKYFNWNLYKNNCQEFTKEILITLDKYDKLKHQYIFRDKVFKIIIPSEFLLHMGNCLFSVSNILQKYIYDSNLFN